MIPFKTSLISPGGDSSKNLETASMRSETSIGDDGEWEATAGRFDLSLDLLCPEYNCTYMISATVSPASCLSLSQESN